MANTASYRAQVRSALVAAIMAANTIAGEYVFGPRPWPTATNLLPCVIVSSPPKERMSGLMKGMQEFETVAYFPVTARVYGTTVQSIDDQIETLVSQIKAAVFAYQPLLDLIEQFPSVDIATSLVAETNDQIAEVNMVFACQYPEFFDAAPGVPLAEIQTTLQDQTTGNTLETFDLKL